MRLLQLFFEWYIKASFHVSLALVSLVAFSARVFDLPVPGHYYWALFPGSVAAYNGIKYGLEGRKHRYPIPGGQRGVLLLSLGCAVLAGYHLAFLPPRVWFLLGVCGAITALYAVPVLPGFRNLRSFGLLKVFLVALVWTLASLWIPAQDSPGVWGWDLQVESLQRLLWVVLLMLPFEIRDVQKDPPALRTIPRRWGLPATRRLAWAGVLAFVLATGLKDSPAPGEWVCKAVTGLLMGLAVSRATPQQGPYYASFWVEGIPIFAFGLLWFLQAV